MRGYGFCSDHLLAEQEVDRATCLIVRLTWIMKDFVRSLKIQTRPRSTALKNDLCWLEAGLWQCNSQPWRYYWWRLWFAMKFVAPLWRRIPREIARLPSWTLVDFAANPARDSGGCVDPYRVHPCASSRSWTDGWAWCLATSPSDPRDGHPGQFIFSDNNQLASTAHMSTYYGKLLLTFNELLPSWLFLEHQLLTISRQKRFAFGLTVIRHTYSTTSSPTCWKQPSNARSTPWSKKVVPSKASKLNSIMKEVLDRILGDAVGSMMTRLWPDAPKPLL